MVTNYRNLIPDARKDQYEEIVTEISLALNKARSPVAKKTRMARARVKRTGASH